MVNFRISEEKKGNVTVLRCEGAIDYSNFSYGDDIVKRLISEGSPRIIFDLGAISFVSSSGWSVFLSNLRAARDNNGTIVLANMHRDVKYSFDLLELDNLIDYYDSVDEAVRRTA